ncbi:baseplate J/gp47 family protein [Roseixanthobacter glucoisosaccharinicivorans]|uniref:baseplate J/gp47 family protein n=1 Tax=Roseixanthobacter glucoisosaccharinicivorans TaxID=3119923 RepID=UPI0037281D3D
MAIVCTIDATGIHAPSLADIRAYFVSSYKAIYGTDVYLESDSQDGQLLDIFSTAIHDCNAQTVACYGAYSPATAQGNGLSSVVKINGIARLLPSKSSVDLLLGGTAGTTINGGYATDADGVQWVLPDSVTIPVEGQITVTATCSVEGQLSAPPDTIINIGTPTRGWQTVTNPEAATEGAPVESDAALRRRQKTSTALPSKTVVDGIVGALLDLPGVARVKPYDNDTNSTDGNGVPAHALAMVVEGGDAQEIASLIRLKKTPGSPTYGTTSEVVTDTYGISKTISFFRPTIVPITVAIEISVVGGYTTAIGELIKQYVADYINLLDIGEDIYRRRLFVPANLNGLPQSETYDIARLLIARDAGPPSASNVTIAFNESASCVIGDITVTVI